MASWGLESGYFKCPAPRSQGLVQKGPDGVLRWFGGVWMHSRGPSSACGLLARAAVCCSEPFPSYPSCLRESTEQLASFPAPPPPASPLPHLIWWQIMLVLSSKWTQNLPTSSSSASPGVAPSSVTGLVPRLFPCTLQLIPEGSC